MREDRSEPPGNGLSGTTQSLPVCHFASIHQYKFVFIYVPINAAVSR
jgi:hypothetical protein